MSLAQPCSVDRYRRTSEFDRKTVGLRLRAVEWQVLFTLDGQKPLTAVAAECALSSDDVAGILARFEGLGLVETQKLTLEEFRSQSRPPEPDVPVMAMPAAAPRVTFSLKRSTAADGG